MNTVNAELSILNQVADTEILGFHMAGIWIPAGTDSMGHISRFLWVTVQMGVNFTAENAENAEKLKKNRR